MIQIEDWVVVAGLSVFLLLCVIYLVYFLKTKKLFPKVIEFQKQINPNTETTILKIDGSGIIKKIEMQVTESENLYTILTVDGKNKTTFRITNGTKNIDKSNYSKQEKRPLILETNLYEKFQKEFSLYINNNSDGLLNSSGKIYYEIKKPN
jgi:hypothetical protein